MNVIDKGKQDALSLHLNSKLGLSIQAATGSGYQSIYELTVTHMRSRRTLIALAL